MISKTELDRMLVRYKAQPVGGGYIDVIVKRENIDQLVDELSDHEIRITCITWWEYVESGSQSNGYGFGGPKSNYYDGWFSEIDIGDDDLEKATRQEIMDIIENKEIVFPSEKKVNYKQDECLTPALWLDVPWE